MNPNGLGNEMLMMDKSVTPVTPPVNDQEVRKVFEDEVTELKKHLEKEPDIMGSLVADQTVLGYVRPIETSLEVKELDPLGLEYAKKKFDAVVASPLGLNGMLKRLKEMTIEDGSYNFPSGRIEVRHNGSERNLVLLDTSGKTIQTLEINPS